MSETTVTFDNGRVYTREGDRYVWRTSPDSIGDIIAERDMVWAFDKLAASQAALAAARREVETVTRERDEANQKLANLIPMPTERMPADREWAHSEWACNQWYLANEAAMHYKAERDTAQQDLATSRAALEDVRKWPARVREKFGITAETQNVCTHGVGYQDTEKRHYWNGYADAVDDAERALAQEAGDGTP